MQGKILTLSYLIQLQAMPCNIYIPQKSIISMLKKAKTVHPPEYIFFKEQQETMS